MSVIVFLKNLWLREFVKSTLTNPKDYLGYFQAFCIANMFLTVTLFGWFKVWLLIKTGFCQPVKYGNINTIKYYHNGIMYLMPCIIKAKKVSKFIKAHAITSSDPESKTIDITNDIKMMLGPGENFGGCQITPKMLGYYGVCISYINDDFETSEINFTGDDILRV